MKNTVATFAQAKAEGRKLAMLTAYDYSTAKLEDEAGIDGILIGDSLGNVVLGYEDTLSVTVEDMIHHSAAVARGAKNALIVCDMPFLSYEVSVPDAVRNAGRLLKEGRANCVKLEGGEEVCPQVAAIVAAGIPVMGHLGLTPQSINAFGGFKVQGKSEAAARKLISDAMALEAAGAFAIVLEAVPAKLAALVTKEVGVPTIGIGAGAGCDGQILVYQDMLGMFSDFVPKFVKQYAELNKEIAAAVESYITEVQNASFPSDEHNFSIDADVLDKFNELAIHAYANPNSNYKIAKDSLNTINDSTKIISDFFHVLPEEIIYTSGSSEANNLAIKGAVETRPNTQIITTNLEHSSVVTPLGYLQTKGYKISFVNFTN